MNYLTLFNKGLRNLTNVCNTFVSDNYKKCKKDCHIGLNFRVKKRETKSLFFFI